MLRNSSSYCSKCVLLIKKLSTSKDTKSKDTNQRLPTYKYTSVQS